MSIAIAFRGKHIIMWRDTNSATLTISTHRDGSSIAREIELDSKQSCNVSRVLILHFYRRCVSYAAKHVQVRASVSKPVKHQDVPVEKIASGLKLQSR